jgi:DNA-binding transcriptional MocR family regulator
VSDGATKKAKAAELWRWTYAITFDHELTSGEKIVAIALSSYVNARSGEAWPSLKLLADGLGTDPKVIARALKKLETRGWITVQRRGGGRRADGSGIPNIYQRSFTRLGAIETTQKQAGKARPTAEEGCHGDTLPKPPREPPLPTQPFQKEGGTFCPEKGGRKVPTNQYREPVHNQGLSQEKKEGYLTDGGVP